MAADRITPIKKAMMTSSHEMDLNGSTITGNKDKINFKKKMEIMMYIIALQFLAVFILLY